MTVNDRWRICFEFRKSDAFNVEIVDYHRGLEHASVSHPGRLLKRELAARRLSANRLVARHWRAVRPDHGHSERAARHHRRHGGAPRPLFRQRAQFWLDLQGQYDIAVVEREKGREIAKRVRPADAA